MSDSHYHNREYEAHINTLQQVFSRLRIATLLVLMHKHTYKFLRYVNFKDVTNPAFS